ncbi:polyphosphate kinase, partial [Pseudomonas sp. PA-1-2A]|uniref:polyphosphate kinase n=1 Tax=Pseudomonas sp. PA-1-2A TaxID=2665464 RepID=UPI001F228E6A
MFESAEIGHAIDKETYDAEVPALREALLEVQYELQQQKRFPVIILINGIEGAGKGETVKLLNEWMDPRLIEVRTFDQQTDEELARPPAWRYWRQLPAKGRMGIFFGNWYSQMLQGRVHGQIKDARLDQAIAGAERLEKMLCDEGALIFKFWFHLSKKQMKARLKALADDPLHSWRISPLDWQQSKTYDKFVHFGERVLRRTSRDYAPWHVIEGVDPLYRGLTVGKILLDGLQSALKQAKVKASGMNPAPLLASVDRKSLLDSLDMTLRLDKDDYEEQLITEQARFSGLMRDKRMRKHALVSVFEGNDAAGKGGAIRRVAAALDPRQYHIVPIAAPSEDERAQPYLWRVWQEVPAGGLVAAVYRPRGGRVVGGGNEGFFSPAG